jgi:hypothetical protein
MANSALDDILQNFKSGFNNMIHGPQKVISPLAAGDNLDEPYKMRYAQDTMAHNTATMQNPGPKTYGENQGHVNIPQSFANAPDAKQRNALQMVRAAHPENKMTDAEIIRYYNKYGDKLIQGPEYRALGKQPIPTTMPSGTPTPVATIPPITHEHVAAAMGIANTATPTVTPSPEGYVMRTPREYVPLITAAAKKYNVPTNILSSLLAHESMGFNPDVISGKINSPVGAQGIAQFMPGTSKGMGVDPYNVESAINGAAKLLAAHYKNFGGDWNKALAAYNAGAGNVKKYGGIPPFKETQNYVKNIMNDSHTTFTGE